MSEEPKILKAMSEPAKTKTVTTLGGSYEYVTDEWAQWAVNQISRLEADLEFYRLRRGQLVIERDNAMAHIAELEAKHERLVKAVKALPVTELVHQWPDGSAEL